MKTTTSRGARVGIRGARVGIVTSAVIGAAALGIIVAPMASAAVDSGNVCEISIHKVDQSGNPLVGAVFTVTTPISAVASFIDPNALGQPYTTYYKATEAAQSPLYVGSTLTTDAKGNATGVITGCAIQTGADYTITETKAPVGATAVAPFKVAQTSADATTGLATWAIVGSPVGVSLAGQFDQSAINETDTGDGSWTSAGGPALTVVDQVQTNGLLLSKESDAGKPLAGAVLSLTSSPAGAITDKSGGAISSVTTAANGAAPWVKVSGQNVTVTVKESSAPAGYLVDSAPVTFTVTNGQWTPTLPKNTATFHFQYTSGGGESDAGGYFIDQPIPVVTPKPTPTPVVVTPTPKPTPVMTTPKPTPVVVTPTPTPTPVIVAKTTPTVVVPQKVASGSGTPGSPADGTEIAAGIALIVGAGGVLALSRRKRSSHQH